MKKSWSEVMRKVCKLSKKTGHFSLIYEDPPFNNRGRWSASFISTWAADDCYYSKGPLDAIRKAIKAEEEKKEDE